MYFDNRFVTSRMRHKVNFYVSKASLNSLFFLDQLPYQAWVDLTFDCL